MSAGRNLSLELYTSSPTDALGRGSGPSSGCPTRQHLFLWWRSVARWRLGRALGWMMCEPHCSSSQTGLCEPGFVTNLCHNACFSHVLYADHRYFLIWLPSTCGWRLTQGKVWASGSWLFSHTWPQPLWIQNSQKLFPWKIPICFKLLVFTFQIISHTPCRYCRLTKITVVCHSMFIITEWVSLINLNPDPVVFCCHIQTGCYLHVYTLVVVVVNAAACSRHLKGGRKYSFRLLCKSTLIHPCTELIIWSTFMSLLRERDKQMHLCCEWQLNYHIGECLRLFTTNCVSFILLSIIFYSVL